VSFRILLAAFRRLAIGYQSPATTNPSAANGSYFAFCIRTGEHPRTSGEDGKDDVRLCIEMARKTMPS
jgi:hypothetical protein